MNLCVYCATLVCLLACCVWCYAVNYLQMKRNTAVSATGVLDNEEDLIKDMDELSLEEARAVLCVLMLCFVLDGSIGKKEQQLWIKMVAKMEAKFGKENSCPIASSTFRWKPTTFQDRLGTDGRETQHKTSFTGKAGSSGERVAIQTKLVPNVVCQRFRNNSPVTCELLVACFDPKANAKLRNDTLKPHHLLVRTHNTKPSR
jgi:hypothetical protein